VNEQGNEFEIVDIYYADCVQQEGNLPQWSTVRTGKDLTDKESLNKLKSQLYKLRRKRKLIYNFGKEMIEVEHARNASVKSILQELIKLPTDGQGLDNLQQLGDVLAQKYLETPWSRTRLFMVIRVIINKEMYVFTLVADLKDDLFPQINRNSLDFTSQTIRNIYGSLKKGSMYPVIIDGKRNGNVITIYDAGRAKYYPRSLECILKQAPEEEVESVIKVLEKTCPLTSEQLDQVVRDIRDINKPTFGSLELGQILRKRGAKVNQKNLNNEWRKQFYYSNYEVAPKALSQQSVTVTIKLDMFEIKCPLNYFPERIEHSEQGGFHFLKLRGLHYSELRTGSSKILFPQIDKPSPA
jgi:hypothetical protein